MIKRVLLAVVILASSAAAAYALNMLDVIVHGTLYQYGLQFSYDWANPYWTLLRVIQALLSVIMVATTVGLLLNVRAHFSKRSSRTRVTQVPKVVAKAPVTTRSPERPLIAHASPSKSSTVTAPSLSPQSDRVSVTKPSLAPVPPVPIPAPASTQKHTETSGLFKCAHCRKTFTQPLRMLDFQGDRPRIVNICPFCNETIASVPREEEGEQTQDDIHPEGRGDYLSRTTMQ
jgi:hypothetical protein